MREMNTLTRASFRDKFHPRRTVSGIAGCELLSGAVFAFFCHFPSLDRARRDE
jgi:hypothetical protein